MTWRIGISSGACVNRPILEMLPDIRRSGAHGVEIGTPPRHFDPWQTAQVASVRQALGALELEAVSIHAPFGGLLDLADADAHHRQAAIAAILAAARAVKTLGGTIIVVHPSDLERSQHDAAGRLANSAESLGILARCCRQEGLTLAVESPLPHLIGGDPEEFRWLLARLDESVRVCLDTGHTALGRHWRPFLNIADGRLLHIHAHDNHGHRDDHLPPGEGQIDWGEITRTLRDANFDGWIMLELHCPDEPADAYFTRALDRASTLLR